MRQTHILRIGSHIQPGDPFWVQVGEAVEQRAHQLGVVLVPIDIDDLPYTAAQEIVLLEELIAQEVDVILDVALPESLVRALLARGVPIVHLMETPVRHALSVSPLGLSAIAQIICTYLAKRMGETGRVAVVGAMRQPDGIVERGGRSLIAGAEATLTAYPAMQWQHVPCSWQYAIARQSLEALFSTAVQPFDALYGLSDNTALAARDAHAQVFPQATPLVIGMNGDPLALAAIAAGTMTATVDIASANFGRTALDLAVQLAQGDAVAPHYAYTPRFITTENVAEIAVEKLVALAGLPNRLVGVNRRQEQQRLTQLETSIAINQRIGSLLDREQLPTTIAELIRQSYGYDTSYIYLWHEQAQCFVRETGYRGETQTIPHATSGLLAHVFAHNEPVFIPNTQHSNRFPAEPKYAAVRTRVVVPIRLGAAVLGVLDLHSRHSTQHTRYELAGLQLLADQLGIALQNADLYADAMHARASALAAQERAEHADQLKTRLLANVSHELRTPLNVIQGYSQAALHLPSPYHEPIPAALLEDLRYIAQSGDHLLRLINDLLDLSRAEIGELDLFQETVDPRQVIEDVFYSLAHQHTPWPDLEWRLAFASCLPFIQADPVRLRQMLINVLSNSAKFTTSGEIVVGAEVVPPHLHIWVRDTGSGIAHDQQQRIFEPFVTGAATQHHEGIGLGLSITRRLVELHHGTLTLESQPGLGSTFHIYLPLPSLQGAPATVDLLAQPVLLLFGVFEQPPVSIHVMCQEQNWLLQTIANRTQLDAALQTVRPMALAWDVASATLDDWASIQHIRRHPELCQIPMLVFDHTHTVVSDTGLTSVLTKPIRNHALLQTLSAIKPAADGMVLIVDDDPGARAIYQRVVAQAFPGHVVQVAEHGALALDVIASTVPSLVLLDLAMPEVDGFTVLAQLRADERTRHVPVVILSGKMLTVEDVARLDYARVTFQSKAILSDDEITSALRQNLANTRRLPQHTSTLVKHALAYMQQHHADSFSREVLAEAVGVNKDYLGEIFRQELGITPWEYLVRYRIAQARTLLTSSSASVAAIAAQVGFDDLSYFSRVFRKHTGASPRMYRNHHV